MEDSDRQNTEAKFEDMQGHISKRVYQSINPYFYNLIGLYILALTIIEVFIIVALIEEYQDMVYISDFSSGFKETTLAGLTFYNLLNSFRARISNSSDIQEFQGIPIVKYTDDNAFSALSTSSNSFLVWI